MIYERLPKDPTAKVESIVQKLLDMCKHMLLPYHISD
jgi:hypothetical protein